MVISIASTVLASPDVALGRVGPRELELNGRQLVDEAVFFRAAEAQHYARGGFGVVLAFSVERTLPTLRDAEVFFLTHAGAIPLEGLLTCVCGSGGSTQTVYLRDCVLEAVAQPPHRGQCVTVRYTVRGAKFESDVPPEEIPGDPDDGEEFVVLRRGKVAIAADATSVDVVFSAPLSSAPTVSCSVSRPTGGDNIWPIVREDTITTDGFTADLSGAPADGTYKLHYIAIE